MEEAEGGVLRTRPKTLKTVSGGRQAKKKFQNKPWIFPTNVQKSLQSSY